MKFFKSHTNRYHEKLEDEAMFASVVSEMASGIISTGLYAKALSECNGNEVIAKAKYVRMRVEMMKSEHAARMEQERLSLIHEKSTTTAEQSLAAAVQSQSSSKIHPILRVFCVVFGALFLAFPFWMGRFEPIVLLALPLGVWFLVCGVKGKSLNPYTGAEE